MRKFFPLYLALLSIVLFGGLIVKHERHLKSSQTIFVELAPVDPRAMLQGDYMALNYQLHFQAASAGNGTALPMQELNHRSQVMSYVQLDTQRRVIQTSFNPVVLNTQPQVSGRLILKNPRNTVDALYPAASSFMFAEGLEPCYGRARFAELKVKENGMALLANLVDRQLKPLNCKNQKNWWQGR